ncbi:MAG: VOC family protein, partial [Thermoleophilia bacterium]|nr:VOC family protein [Thermoleophilia bacterium]
VTEFVSAVPIIPARDVAAAAEWYRDQLEYDVVHIEPEYGIVRRGESSIHFWGPSGIAPEASNTMIRVGVRGIDDLYAEYSGRGIVHPNDPLTTKPWNLREFSVGDRDGNLVTFFEPPAGGVAGGEG